MIQIVVQCNTHYIQYFANGRLSKRAEPSESAIVEGGGKASIQEQISNQHDFPEAYATSYFESPIPFEAEINVCDEYEGNISDDISEYGSTDQAEKALKGLNDDENSGMSYAAN